MKKILLVLFALFCLNKAEFEGKSDPEEDRNHILSRRKRYLTFPDGSSLQLVICMQQSAMIPIGDIFLVASTAALAWELPKDPKLFHMFNKHGIYNDTHRGDNIYDENIGANKSYKRKQFFHPIFVKRSTENKQVPSWKNLNIKINRKEMHEKQMGRNYLTMAHTDQSVLNFHRASRASFYRKLEFLFKAVGWDGKQCVLRRLCESGRYAPQGSFLQELMRIIFTLPKGPTTETDVNTSMKKYDAAHSSLDCNVLYPNCPNIHNLNDIKFTFDNYYK